MTFLFKNFKDKEMIIINNNFLQKIKKISKILFWCWFFMFLTVFVKIGDLTFTDMSKDLKQTIEQFSFIQAIIHYVYTLPYNCQIAVKIVFCLVMLSVVTFVFQKYSDKIKNYLLGKTSDEEKINTLTIEKQQLFIEKQQLYTEKQQLRVENRQLRIENQQLHEKVNTVNQLNARIYELNKHNKELKSQIKKLNKENYNLKNRQV